MSEQKRQSITNRMLQALAIVAAALVVALLLWSMIMRTVNQLTISVPPGAGETALQNEARLLLDRAADSVQAVELVLSFLEGASVLIGLGFGAATIYGLRSSRETREELSAEVAKIEDIRQTLEMQLAELQVYRPYLENLSGLRQELEESQESLEQTINNVARLLQADQEFRLKNYDTAYAFAEQVLQEEPANPMALYIAGWLEVQHLSDKLDEGIAHLQRVAAQEIKWPTARAAYGVGIRRKARAATGEERDRLFLRAEGVIKEALSQAPRLMDFEGESFWGPVGGILRERGELDSAIRAYEQAIAVTPGSSYPWGNLAGLYLMKARTGDDPEWLQKALIAFENTLETSSAELAMKPNNYYLLMDVAQAMSVLGQRDPASFVGARKALAEALSAEVSINSLETSLRGWRDLLENCPVEWDTVRAALDESLRTIERAIQARG